MAELHHTFALLNAGTAIVALVLVAFAWRRRDARGAGWLAALMLGVAIWSGAAAVMWYVPGQAAQSFWLKATFLGVWMVPVAFLVLALDVAGLSRWRSPIIAFLVTVSFAFVGAAWLNPGRLYETGLLAQPMGSYTHYQAVPGPLYFGYNVFAFIVLIGGVVITFRAYLRSHGTERTQAGIVLLGALVPIIASAVTESGVVPLRGLDLAPVAFLVTGAIWVPAILRGLMLEIVPMARDALVEQMSDGVVVLDAEDRVVDANPAALAMLHAPSAATLGNPVEGLFQDVEGATDLLGDSGPLHAVLQIGSDGDARHVEFRVTPLVIGSGARARLVTLHDVTDEQRANEGLRLARTVFDATNEGIVVLRPDANQQVVDVNDAFCRLTGRPKAFAVGRDLVELQSDRHQPAFYESMRHTLSRTAEWKGEVWLERANGVPFPSWLSLSLAKDGQDRVSHVVGVFTDMAEISREADEKLRHHATHDALTGLPNRLLLDDRLELAVARARRTRHDLAVLLVDLDEFKDVNDTLGHSQGDVMLVEVARRIVPLVRESDTVARPGGDEFAIILADVPDPEQVEATARRLLDAVATPYRIGGVTLHVTASVGIAMFAADGTDATTLMQHADLAMHRAKGLGRNRIQFFSETFRAGLDRRMVIESELWGADEEGRYSLLYQPQVDLATGAIAGVEALVRLRSRDGTVLSPAEFVPIAEESELIFQLGDWVFRKACEDTVALHRVAPDLTMSVNFSARQFREIDVAVLEDALRTCGVEARFLVIEITETALLDDSAEAAVRLQELRGVTGLRLSLDDFGTGYSSLTYARMLHADSIKIDRSFVSLLPDDLEAQAIVLSTITLAKGLHAKVVAEGPETVEQVRFLRANGCHYAQGYYFSRPIPVDELMLLLGEGVFPLPDAEIVSATRP